MEKLIAERKLMFSLKGTSERMELYIKIGLPYWLEEQEIAACPVEWSGLPEFAELSDTRGMDLLQALHMAVDIDPLLQKLEKKYDFYWPSGEPY